MTTLFTASRQRQFCTSTFSSARLVAYLVLLSGRSRSFTRNRNITFFAAFIRSCRYVFVPIPSLKPSFERSFSPYSYRVPYFCLVPRVCIHGQYPALGSSFPLPYRLDFSFPSCSRLPLYFLPYSPVNNSLQSMSPHSFTRFSLNFLMSLLVLC